MDIRRHRNSHHQHRPHRHPRHQRHHTPSAFYPTTAGVPTTAVAIRTADTTVLAAAITAAVSAATISTASSSGLSRLQRSQT